MSLPTIMPTVAVPTMTARVSTQCPMDKGALARLFNYHYYTSRQLWGCVEILPDHHFSQPLEQGARSIRSQLIGMVAHENLWINYLWHGQVEFLKECQLPTRACIRQEWDALEEEILDYLDDLNLVTLERDVRPDFVLPTTTFKVWELLLQIIHHAAQSRAQIEHSLKRLGAPTPAEHYADFFVK